MGRDERPEIPPHRRRASAADFWPEAAAAERRRVETEQQRHAARAEPERKPEPEPDEELEEPSLGVKQQVREAMRQLRGG